MSAPPRCHECKHRPHRRVVATRRSGWGRDNQRSYASNPDAPALARKKPCACEHCGCGSTA